MGTRGKPPNFLELLERLERRYGSKQAVAAAIGITPSRYSRVRRGNAYGLNTENCLRLAVIGEWDVDQVLRAAGKADVADMLAILYGRSPVKHPDLTAKLMVDETAARVRSFLDLSEALQQWMLDRPPQLDDPPALPQGDESKREQRVEGRTTSARGPRQ